MMPRRSESRDRRVILTYHAVESGPKSMAEDSFRAQVDWLSAHAAVVSLDTLLEGKSSARLQVAVTFDDGYESLLRVAAPVLRRAGLVATGFMSTRCIGDSYQLESDAQKGHYPGERFLRWDEVKSLRDLGWTIGSHSADHVDLTRQSEAELLDQLTISKATIEKRLEASCTHLAYPWGRHNRLVREVAARCGYQWAVSTLHGAVAPDDDRYAIPRIDIRKDYEAQDFVSAVTGDWDYLKTVQTTRRRLSEFIG